MDNLLAIKCMNGECQDINQVIIARAVAVAALEKQIPKEIDFELNLGDYESRFTCKCGKKILVRHDRGVMDNHNAPNYCPNCGQALDWGGAN